MKRIRIVVNFKDGNKLVDEVENIKVAKTFLSLFDTTVRSLQVIDLVAKKTIYLLTEKSPEAKRANYRWY